MLSAELPQRTEKHAYELRLFLNKLNLMSSVNTQQYIHSAYTFNLQDLTS